VTGQRFIVAAAVIGLAVLTIALFASSLVSVRTIRIDSFQRTADPQKLVVNVVLGLGDELAERTVDEDARNVRITVRVREPAGARDLIGVPVPILVTLRAPLDGRSVLDYDGSAVRDLGQYLGPARRLGPRTGRVARRRPSARVARCAARSAGGWRTVHRDRPAAKAAR
jgi:hypothetical protein